MKTLIVACGAGVATSTLIVDRIKDLLDRNQIQAKIIQCNLGEISGYATNADLIVSSMRIDKNFNIPVILGIPFLTGIGKEDIEKEIINHLK